jgi:hypothetical protein
MRLRSEAEGAIEEEEFIGPMQSGASRKFYKDRFDDQVKQFEKFVGHLTELDHKNHVRLDEFRKRIEAIMGRAQG